MSRRNRVYILNNRLPEVDALRGLAALGVLLAHTFHEPSSGILNWEFFAFFPFQLGYIGVPLFIVISGFCIHRATAFAPDWKMDWRGFWVRRFIRLYPTYLAAIVLSLSIYYSLGPEHYRPWERIQSLPADLLAHLLLVHNLFPQFGQTLGNGPFWTLGLEEQLYLFYPVTLILRRRIDISKMLLFVATITVGWIFFVNLMPTEGNSFANWPFAYWLLWVLGSVSADAYAGRIRLPKWSANFSVGMAFVAFGCLSGSKVFSRFLYSNWLEANPGLLSLRPHLDPLVTASHLLLGLGFFIILNFSIGPKTPVIHKFLRSRLIGYVGLMSYSLYLTHLPFLHLLEAVTQLNHEGGFLNNIFRLCVFIPLALLFSAAFFHLVERQFLNKRVSTKEGDPECSKDSKTGSSKRARRSSTRS
jgi:peptidoglycan/LPS O-acetylase OafA/YrhL